MSYMTLQGNSIAYIYNAVVIVLGTENRTCAVTSRLDYRVRCQQREVTSSRDVSREGACRR